MRPRVLFTFRASSEDADEAVEANLKDGVGMDAVKGGLVNGLGKSFANGASQLGQGTVLNAIVGIRALNEFRTEHRGAVGAVTDPSDKRRRTMTQVTWEDAVLRRLDDVYTFAATGPRTLAGWRRDALVVMANGGRSERRNRPGQHSLTPELCSTGTEIESPATATSPKRGKPRHRISRTGLPAGTLSPSSSATSGSSSSHRKRSASSGRSMPGEGPTVMRIPSAPVPAARRLNGPPSRSFTVGRRDPRGHDRPSRLPRPPGPSPSGRYSSRR